MPPVVIGAAVGAGIATGVGLAVGTVAATAALSYFATAFASTLVLGAVSQALAKDPNYSALDQGQTLTTRNATGAHNIVYGRTRIGGHIIYMAVTDKQYDVNSQLWVGSGDMGDYQTVTTTKTTKNAYLHLVIALAGHEIDAVEGVYTATENGVTELELDENGLSLSTSKYGNKIRVQYKLGADDQTAFADLITDTANLGDSKWTANHRVRGSALAYIRMEFDSNKFKDGLPTFSFKVRGKKVYDPRTETTVWSANAALCLNDYLTNTRYGLGCDYATEIDETALIAAANVCDEDVSLDAGGTENRYECHGMIPTSNRPDDIIGKILSSMGGKAVWSGGKWRIIPAVYYTPTLTFDENDLRGPLQVQTLISRRDSFNTIKGVFSSADQDYIATSFPQVANSTAITQDGESVYRDIELPFTTSASMAQRLAKIELLKARQQITTTLPLKLQGLKANVGDIVQVNNTRLGWSAKKFEVVSANIGTGEVLGVDLALREISADVFDWSTSEEQAFDPAPNTALTSAFEVGVPYDLSFSATKYYDTGYGVIEWSCDDSFVTEYDVTVEGYTEDFSTDYWTFSGKDFSVYHQNNSNAVGKSYANFLLLIPNSSFDDLAKFKIGSTLKFGTNFVSIGNPAIADVLRNNKLTITSSSMGILNTAQITFSAELSWVSFYSQFIQKVMEDNALSTNILITSEPIRTQTSTGVYYKTTVTEPALGVQNLLEGKYQVTIASRNVLGIVSDPFIGSFDVPNPPLPNRVSGLELDLGDQGEANATEWTGRDVKLKWRHASFSTSYDLNDLEANGADDGMPDAYFKDYKVAVYNSSGNLLREEFVTTNAYVYTYEKNAEDAAKQGDTAYRTLSFKVWARGKQNQISTQAATL